MAGIVLPPTRRAAPLRLLDSIGTPSDLPDPERWELGFDFQPSACAGGGRVAPCDVGTLDIPSREARRSYEPFIVWGGDECSAFGFQQADYEAHARENLDLITSEQVAAELWTGEIAQDQGWDNPYLASADADTVTTGPAAVIDVLACLEQALAGALHGARGMIHATPQLVTHWAALGPSVMRREGNRLLTVHDTIVVADGGYTGDGPNGEPAGETVWAYATSMVDVRLGAVTVSPDSIDQAIDIRDNTIAYIAWRPAAVTWDGCALFAAEADLEVCAVGGVS